MGAWGVKILQSDEVLDMLDNLMMNCKLESLPFVTELLLIADNEMYRTLGVVIVACTKKLPKIEWLIEGDSYYYVEFFNKIYRETCSNNKFKKDMEFYSGYVHSAITYLEEHVENWSESSRENRKEYINILKGVING